MQHADGCCVLVFRRYNTLACHSLALRVCFCIGSSDIAVEGAAESAVDVSSFGRQGMKSAPAQVKTLSPRAVQQFPCDPCGSLYLRTVDLEEIGDFDTRHQRGTKGNLAGYGPVQVACEFSIRAARTVCTKPLHLMCQWVDR
jgi:hypothetical protein